MPKTISQEERQMIKFVEKMPLPEEEKTGWLERIRNGEMSEELAEEIRHKFAAHNASENDERAQAQRARMLVELSTLVKHWRLSNQSRNFGRK